jgi:hypothetical protein
VQTAGERKDTSMAVIENTTLIERAPEEVFDYLVDLRNDGQRTRLISRFDARPRGLFRVVFPLFLAMMKRQERANMVNLKAALETHPSTD